MSDKKQTKTNYMYEGWSAEAQQQHQMVRQLQMRAEAIAQREIEKTKFSVPVMVAPDRTQHQAQQQQQSGALLNLSATDIADNHAKQKDYIARLMNEVSGAIAAEPKTVKIATVNGKPKVGASRKLAA